MVYKPCVSVIVKWQLIQENLLKSRLNTNTIKTEKPFCLKFVRIISLEWRSLSQDSSNVQDWRNERNQGLLQGSSQETVEINESIRCFYRETTSEGTNSILMYQRKYTLVIWPEYIFNHGHPLISIFLYDCL